MAYVYEDVNPSLIENTTMKRVLQDGVNRGYRISPVSGYVLHDKNADWTDVNPDTMEETYMLGYKRGTVTCGATYDFTANPREFYAVLETDVPADQIFGGGNNDHEVM